MKYFVPKGEISQYLSKEVSNKIPISIVNRILPYIVLFGFISFTFSGWFHFHKEVNLHFHAENLLTSDHTKYVDNDCEICDLFLLSPSFFLDSKESGIYKRISAKAVSSSKHELSLSYLIEKQSGRAPPKI